MSLLVLHQKVRKLQYPVLRVIWLPSGNVPKCGDFSSLDSVNLHEWSGGSAPPSHRGRSIFGPILRPILKEGPAFPTCSDGLTGSGVVCSRLLPASEMGLKPECVQLNFRHLPPLGKERRCLRRL